MDPIRPIGPGTANELRVIPVAPARIRERDPRQGARERNRNRARDRSPSTPTPEGPGRVDIQA